ncbi:MAG: hypothetical protein N2487_00885 [Verrucomicrobiae bacterium]|nr:hypothetical protein [Verrucomicrobiae bacterium]
MKTMRKSLRRAPATLAKNVTVEIAGFTASPVKNQFEETVAETKQ